MTVEDAILALSKAWDEALTDNDADRVGDFMTDDWVYVGPDGLTPKSEVIASIASGRLVHHTIEPVGRPRIAQAGDAVLLTARKISSGSVDEVPYTTEEWITEVFVPSGVSWRCCLSHKAVIRIHPEVT